MKFKKLMAAVTTGVLAVTSLSLSGLIGSAEVQELMNDTFESGYGAWKGVGSSLSLSTEQAHNGGTSLYCYDRTANWGAPRCSLTGIVAAGQSYEISASAMYEGSGQQNMAIKMIYTDANGTDHYDQVAAAQATAGQWVEIKGNYTVPSGATDMILYVEMPDANTDQTYYIDDVVIKGEKTEIQLDDKFESDFDNNSTQKWNGRGSAKVELSTKYAHSGTTSLYVSGRTQLWNGATRSLSDIMEAGGYYKVGTYVLYDGDQYSDTQKFSINLQYDLNGKENYYTSATETAAIMIPLLICIANDIGVSRSKLLYPSMACANIATQMTFLGQGASNMAWNDVMMQAGAPTPLHVWDFTIARIPMLTIAILYMTFVGYKLMPDIPNEQFSDAAHTASESEKLSPFKRKLAVLIVLVSIAMMLLENVIGVKMYLTSCIGAAALVLTGVLTEKEALNSIHQPTIFLFAGVLALSDAIQTTGAGDVVADWMIRLLGDTTNPYIIMLVFFLVPFILTQVMSNLATLTIFIPLVTSACIRMGVDPRAAVVGVITASCVSIMTPMAAPCQIMIIEPGGYTLKDYLKCGTPLALILIVLSVFFLPTLYPFA